MLLLCLLLGLGVQGQQPSHSEPSTPGLKAEASLVPVTKSAEAREALQRGVVKWENHRMAEAVNDYRKATQADPDFAVAHLFLSTLTPDPEEQSRELQKALALRDKSNRD